MYRFSGLLIPTSSVANRKMPPKEKRVLPRGQPDLNYSCMFGLRTFSWPSWALFVLFAVGLVTGQDSTPAAQPPDAAQTASSPSTSKRIVFDDFVDSVVRQERRLTEVMRSFKPIIETYIQEEGVRPRFQAGIIPDGDDYFLGRLDLTGNLPSIVPFADEETWKRTEEFFVQDTLPFNQ